VEQQELSFIAVGRVKSYGSFIDLLAGAYITKHTINIKSSNYTVWCLLKEAENL
jgi:hypothetical protein